MRKLLLSIVYFALVVPAGLVGRLVRDPLARRVDRSAATYWITSTGGVVGGKAAVR
ncbi:hypothetical protein [Streptomyces sp. NPDC045251]|uniref:hypothetical protein n=1 Tax=unclassified Streptomyces TaxID=2593676 RepID=UPI0033D6DF3C